MNDARWSGVVPFKNAMDPEAKKKLMTEWAVLEQLWLASRDLVVREAIEARRHQLRAQISALSSCLAGAREAA